MASVEIAGLRKLYGDVVALADINVSVQSGSFFTLGKVKGRWLFQDSKGKPFFSVGLNHFDF